MIGKNRVFALFIIIAGILYSSNLMAQDTAHFRVVKLAPKNKYLVFYLFLKNQGYPDWMLGTLSEFTHKIKIKYHAIKLYQGLRKDGYSVSVLGTEEQFVKEFCSSH